MTRHTEDCPFADIKCPCQGGDGAPSVERLRRWIVNVPAYGPREVEARDEFQAAQQLAEEIGTMVHGWPIVCEVVPILDVVDAVLGQVAPVLVEVERVVHYRARR